MDCPRCNVAMQEEALPAHLGRRVTIDVCQPCQAIWFDARESVSLTPGATLALLRIIGEQVAPPRRSNADRQQMQSVHCANCGAPVDLTAGSGCSHCGAPLSMLDLTQPRKLVQQLQQAADRTAGPVDPSLPIELARARREVEGAFARLPHSGAWRAETPDGLVEASFAALVRWLKTNGE